MLDGSFQFDGGKLHHRIMVNGAFGRTFLKRRGKRRRGEKLCRRKLCGGGRSFPNRGRGPALMAEECFLNFLESRPRLRLDDAVKNHLEVYLGGGEFFFLQEDQGKEIEDFKEFFRCVNGQSLLIPVTEMLR